MEYLLNQKSRKPGAHLNLEGNFKRMEEAD